jgi:hypothetical protein
MTVRRNNADRRPSAPETAARIGHGAAYRRIARNKGADVAIFAIARKLAQLVYRMMRYGQDYLDIGEVAYDRQFEARRLATLKQTAKSMGFELTRESARPQLSPA